MIKPLMNAKYFLIMPNRMLALVFVLALCVSAQGSLTFTTFTPGSFTAPGTGLIDNNGFTDNEPVSGISGYSLVSLVLTLNFSDDLGLDISGAGSSAITGVLTLYNSSGALGSASLTDITVTGSPGDWVYTADFSTSFAGLNPNNTWGLALSFPSTDTTDQNTLNSWSLDITAGVPEPVNYALAGFGVMFAGITAGRFLYLRRPRHARAEIGSQTANQ
jgi:hypothetical protein